MAPEVSLRRKSESVHLSDPFTTTHPMNVSMHSPVPYKLRRSLDHHLPPQGFARRVVVLLGGGTLGQLLGAIALPVVTRLYTPADYGVLGIYMLLLVILVPLATLHYEAGIPAAESDQVGARLVVLAISAAACTALVAAVCLFVFGAQITRFSSFRDLLPYGWLVPLGLTLAGAYQALSCWCIRKHDFKLLARTKIAQGAGMVFAQLLLGVSHFGPAGLLVGHMLGQSSGITTIIRRIRAKDRDSFHQINADAVLKVARQYQRFPKISVGALLLESASVNVPLLFFAGMYGVTVMGWVSLAFNVLTPFSVLTVNIGQVYFAELSQLKLSNPTATRHAFLRRLKQVSLFGLALSTLAALLAPVLIPLVLGTTWKNSVLCVEIWIPVVLVAFVASPFGWAVDALQRQDLHLIRGGIRLILPASALGAAHFMKVSWVAALALLSAAIAISYVFYGWLSWIAVRRFSLNATAAKGAEEIPVEIIEASTSSFTPVL